MRTYAETIRKNNMIGQYDYVKAGIDIKTRYSIEFTRNQKIFDIMDTTKFTFDMLNKLEYDYLQDAITDYIKLHYDESVLHVMLFEEIILNGETILEQCIKDSLANKLTCGTHNGSCNATILEMELLRNVPENFSILCDNTDCIYNGNKKCHAPSLEMEFDTYAKTDIHEPSVIERHVDLTTCKTCVYR